MTVRVFSQSTPLLSLGHLSCLFFSAHTGVLNLYLKVSCTALFPLPVAPSIELLMPPHGHNRGIMGASTWFTLLSVSPEGANCWSQGCERPASAEFLQTNTARGIQHRCAHIRSHANTHTHTKWWSLSRSDRFHPATLYHCGMSGATMAFDTSHQLTTMSSNFEAPTGHNGPLFTSESLLFFCMISRTKPCYRSTNWAWTISHKGIWEANCTTLWAVWCEGKLAAHPAMLREIIQTWLCCTTIDL